MLDGVQKLRELTGAGVLECQRALEDAAGNLEKAVQIIHERGQVKAEKRSDRITGAGLLESYIHNERVGVLLDLRVETDFVARSADFRELAHNLAMQIAAMAPENVEELLEQVYIKDEALTIDALIKQSMAKLGENIRVEKFVRYEI